MRILDVFPGFSHGVSINFYQFLVGCGTTTQFFWIAFCHKSASHLFSLLRSSKTPEIVARLGWVEKVRFEFESQLIYGLALLPIGFDKLQGLVHAGQVVATSNPVISREI